MNILARIVTKLWPPVGETTQSTGLSAPLPALDGLRFAAILAIFLSALPAIGLSPVDAILDRLSIGHELFLVVYAYSLTRLLIFEQRRTGQLVLRNYLMRRLLSLVPVSFILIAGLLIWGFATDGASVLPDAIGIATFTQNLHTSIVGPTDFSPLIHADFLSALLQYALVLPVLATIAVGSSRVFAFVAFAWLLLSLAFSLILVLENWPAVQVVALSPFRPEAILVGMAIAVFESHFWKFRRKRLIGVLAIVLALAGISIFEIEGPAGWQDIVRLAASAVLSGLFLTLALMWQPVTRLLALTPIVWIGRMFLTLYILHWPCILIVAQLAERLGFSGWQAWMFTSVFSALASIIVAAGIWYLIERRIHKLRRHYEFIEGRSLHL